MAEDFHCCTQLCRRRARKCAVAAQSSDNCGNSAHFSLFSSLPPGPPCFPLLLTSPPPPPACSEAVIASNGFLLQLPTLSLICHPLSSHRQMEMWRFKIDRGKTIPSDQCLHNSSSLHHQKSGGLVVAVVVTISLSKLSSAHNSR